MKLTLNLVPWLTQFTYDISMSCMGKQREQSNFKLARIAIKLI